MMNKSEEKDQIKSNAKRGVKNESKDKVKYDKIKKESLRKVNKKDEVKKKEKKKGDD